MTGTSLKIKNKKIKIKLKLKIKKRYIAGFRWFQVVSGRFRWFLVLVTAKETLLRAGINKNFN